MTRFIHDRFAKDYLAEMLSPIGTVNIGRDVTSEVREIDVYFTPTTVTSAYVETLGILGKMANATAIFEPFRNPVIPILESMTTDSKYSTFDRNEN
ncbi:hypothetical protein BCD67_04475 [Oscillatoriales cyanobacterium USR001]|nr:hypothetical protein BCD67_04475 [Oscillatoriales cyanobacterium USR001]